MGCDPEPDLGGSEVSLVLIQPPVGQLDRAVAGRCFARSLLLSGDCPLSWLRRNVIINRMKKKCNEDLQQRRAMKGWGPTPDGRGSKSNSRRQKEKLKSPDPVTVNCPVLG